MVDSSGNDADKWSDHFSRRRYLASAGAASAGLIGWLKQPTSTVSAATDSETLPENNPSFVAGLSEDLTDSTEEDVSLPLDEVYVESDVATLDEGNGEIVIEQDGVYQIDVIVTWDGTDAGTQLKLEAVAGGNRPQQYESADGQWIDNIKLGMEINELESGDTIEIIARHRSGTATIDSWFRRTRVVVTKLDPLEDEATTHDAGVTEGIFTELVDGNVVAIADELSTPRSIDPGERETPIQDALDVLADNGGGEIRLPPTTVVENETIEPYSHTRIVGFGPTVSAISIAEPGIDGIRFADPGGVEHVRLDGFSLNGPGLDADSGAAICHSQGDTQNLAVSRIVFWAWNDAVYRVEEGVGPFQCRHDLLTVYECDAGDANGLFEFRSWYGPANWFGTIAVYPSAQHSGENSTVFFTRGGTQRIEYLTMGGTAAPALHQKWDAHVEIDHLHWEPVGLVSTPDSVVRLEGRGPARIGSAKHVTGTADHFYRLENDPYMAALPARKRLGTYYPVGSEATLSGNVVDLAAPNDPGLPSFYWGNADDVAVTHDEEETGGFRAMGGAGTPVG